MNIQSVMEHKATPERRLATPPALTGNTAVNGLLEELLQGPNRIAFAESRRNMQQAKQARLKMDISLAALLNTTYFYDKNNEPRLPANDTEREIAIQYALTHNNEYTAALDACEAAQVMLTSERNRFEAAKLALTVIKLD